MELTRVGDIEVSVEGRAIRIARLHGDKYKFLDDPEACLEKIKGAGVRADVFTFMQRLPATAARFNYPMEIDNLAVLPITNFDDWFNKIIRFKVRNKLRKSEKNGVEVHEVTFNEELIHAIWEIYNETPIRQGKRFPHYGMTLERVRSYAGTFLDSSIFIAAFFENRIIGFVKLVPDETNTQAGLMHIVSLVQHRDKAPTNALIAQAVKSCAERTIRYLVYSNFSYGNKQRDSLAEFKEHNGFRKMDVPRYYVPLTLFGRIVLRLRLHHGPLDRVPERVLACLRQLRNGWYSRKCQLTREF